MRVLTHLLDNKRQAMPCHCKILKTTNNVAILTSLLRGKSITIRTTRTLKGSHMVSHSSTLHHTSTGKKLQSILALSKERHPDEGEDTSIPKK
jgi:hypothetical protein